MHTQMKKIEMLACNAANKFWFEKGNHCLLLQTLNVLMYILNVFFHSKGTTITFGKLFDCLPYQNNLYLVTIMGRYLRETMDISASNWSSGQFLQVSGFNVTYNLLGRSNEKNGEMIEVSKIYVGDHELVDDKEYIVNILFYISTFFIT